MGRRVYLALVMALALAVPSRAGEGLVALQTADPSCPVGRSGRYTDCGNGTVTDNQTGLVWLANASCLGKLNWHEAIDIVAGLSDLPYDEHCVPNGVSRQECDCNLRDGSSPGEWRLPSWSELTAMVEDAREMGCNPSITIDDGTDCWFSGCHLAPAGDLCSFYGVKSSAYWSSSSVLENPLWAWGVHLDPTDSYNREKSELHYVWPVRGGQ